MRSKKGAEVLGFPIVQMFWIILAIVVVMGVLLWYVNGLGDRTNFQKNFLSTDLALIMDTLYAMPQPGALFVIYQPKKVQKDIKIPFSYVFSGNYVVVREGESDSRAGLAYFTPRNGLTAEESTLTYSEVLVMPMITKQDDIITANDVNNRDFDYSRNVLTCTGPGIKKKFQIKALSGEVSERIAKMFSGTDAATTDTSSPTIFLATPDSKEVKVYVNGNSNPAELVVALRAGCEIVNKVRAFLYSQDLEVDETGVIAINPLQTSDENDDSLKSSSILVSIGTKTPHLQNTDFQRGISNAIKEGIIHARS